VSVESEDALSGDIALPNVFPSLRNYTVDDDDGESISMVQLARAVRGLSGNRTVSCGLFKTLQEQKGQYADRECHGADCSAVAVTLGLQPAASRPATSSRLYIVYGSPLRFGQILAGQKRSSSTRVSQISKRIHCSLIRPVYYLVKTTLC